MPLGKEIEDLIQQLTKMYNPQDIILFGSRAKGRVRRGSDVDLCVVLETNNKRKTMADILLSLDSDVDLDIVIYTPTEWACNKGNMATFPGLINRTGVSLIG